MTGAAAVEATPRVDAEFRDLIPRPTDDELAGLRDSLREHGCLDPLVVWEEEGILLDGHNRLAICEEEGIDYETKTISLPSREGAKCWIIRHQLGRRNLPAYVKGELLMSLKAILAEEALQRKREGWKSRPDPEPENAVSADGDGARDLQQNSAEGYEAAQSRTVNEQLAAAAGLSHDTIHKIGVIAENADEETKQQLRQGKLSVNAGYNRTRKGMGKATKRGKKAAEAKRERTRVAATERCASCDASGMDVDLVQVFVCPCCRVALSELRRPRLPKSLKGDARRDVLVERVVGSIGFVTDVLEETYREATSEDQRKRIRDALTELDSTRADAGIGGRT